MSTFEQLIDSLGQYHASHKLADAYYEGTMQVPDLGISVPPILKHVQEVIGWPGTVVDVLEERLDWYGWDDNKVLETVYEENQLSYESSLGHLDSLLYGVSFMAAHVGRKGEPDILVTSESAKDLTGLWDRRKRRLTVAASVKRDGDGKVTGGAFYTENETHFYGKIGERWVSDGKPDRHNLGRVPIVRMINRGRAGRRGGKSEISRAVRGYTDAAVRTLLGMEINREFYSAPQRYVLGAKEDAFVDEAGNPVPGWKAIMGSVWGLERDDEALSGDGLPVVGQFDPSPPGPYLEQIRGLGQLLSAEAGIPPTYLGFATDQAASADAIRALEARLVKRAERRQDSWSPSYKELGEIILMLQGENELENIHPIWRDAATPTRSADTDRTVKLVQIGMMPPSSSVAMEMAGLSPSQQKRLKRDRNEQAFLTLLQGGGMNEPGSDESADFEDESGAVEGVESGA